MLDDADRILARAARPLPEVARVSIRAALDGNEPVPPVVAEGPLAEPAPVFVTLRIDERLRGCIGTLVAMHDNVVEETMDRARAAAFDDPRFPPLQRAELERLWIEVSILRPLEEIASHADLDPARYGIEVRDAEGRRGVLLPEIDGVETAAQQIAITREKAGIPRGVELQIRRFSVVKVSD